jgi:PEP-CTERM/exosortase A-associated glycosyltransferase
VVITLKVLHVLDTSIPDLAGYTTRGYYLAMNQKKLGCHPVILTSERFSNPNNCDEEEIEGIKYYRTQKQNSLIRKIPILAEINEIQTLYQRVAEVADQEKVDIIHAHSPSLIGAACLNYCKKTGIPLIYEIRAFWEDAAVDKGAFEEGSLKYKIRRYHETNIVKKADMVIVICDGIKNELIKRGIPENKINIVRNGVDSELFQPLKPNLELKDQISFSGKTIIGFIGTFFHFEGLQDIIAAMKIISQKNKDIVLLLVGTGQVEAELRNLTKEYGLEKKVFFTRKVPHSQIKEYYSIIDVLVYPRIEKRITDLVTPLKPLEAMAMEKAVLMSDVGGLKELAREEGVAHFFHSGAIKDLAVQCLKLCTDNSLRQTLGKKARKYVLVGWGWEVRAKEDFDVYNQLLGKR